MIRTKERIINIVIGTRPEIIKVTPVIENLERLSVPYYLVWSGQHYDYEMSKVFFEELGLPDPHKYLETARNTNNFIATLTSLLMQLHDLISTTMNHSYVYALGDTNTTLATALAAYYSSKVFIHDEAGMRSYDVSMVEEFNRKVADMVATLRLAPTRIAYLNLLIENVDPGSVFIVGSTIVDALIKAMPIIKKRKDYILAELSLEDNSHIVITVHRRENLKPDKARTLVRILISLARSFREKKIVFPIHPHTRKILSKLGYLNKLNKEKNIILIKPLSYINFLALLDTSVMIITDSGGVQEEAFILGKDTITLRDRTEWPETVIMGVNHITGLSVDLVLARAREIISKKDSVSKRTWLSNLEKNPLGDGRAGYRIAKLLNIIAEQGIGYLVTHLRDKLKVDPANPLVVTKVIPCNFDDLGKSFTERGVGNCLSTHLCVRNGFVAGTHEGLFSIDVFFDNKDKDIRACDFYICRGKLDNPEQYIRVNWYEITKIIDTL